MKLHIYFFLFSKNKFGVSEKSNKVTLMPSKTKRLLNEDLGLDSYSDSIQNFYKSKYTVDSSMNINIMWRV